MEELTPPVFCYIATHNKHHPKMGFIVITMRFAHGGVLMPN
jgi:hypothetical protein